MDKVKRFFKKAFSKSPVLFGFICSFLLGSFVVYAYGVGTRNIFVAGEVISAAKVNENFKNLYDVVSTGLLVKSTANVSVSKSCAVSWDGMYFTCPTTSEVILTGLELDNVIFGEDGNFSNSTGVYSVVLPGVYKAEVTYGSITYTDASTPTCYTAMGRGIFLEFNGIKTNIMSKSVFLGSGDTINIYLRYSLEGSNAGDSCSGTLEFPDIQLLIRKIL